MGGWGLLNLKIFGRALLCKSLWRAIQGDGLWSRLIKSKYLANKDLDVWYRRGKLGIQYGSPIWCSFRKVEAIFLEQLIWKFHKGNKIIIGKDCFRCGSEVIDIPISLINHLHRGGIFFWDKLIATWDGPVSRWKDSSILNIPKNYEQKWYNIVRRLQNGGITYTRESDFLAWDISGDPENISVKGLYQLMIGQHSSWSPSFPLIFWKDGCPMKMVLFAWLVFHNRI